MAGRTGVPVTTACGSGVPSQPTAAARANGPSRRLAAPGTASTFTSTSGTRQANAATEAGRLAYPPTDTTTAGRRRTTMATARTAAQASPAAAPRLAATAPGRTLRTSPRPGSRVKGKPPSPSTWASCPRREPTNSMEVRSWPAATRASATDSAGCRWPAVPPPATSA